jgi:cobalt/nickel transport system permease protein
MHLPDGFLSLPVAASAGAASTAAVGIALRRCRATLDDRAEALLGVTAAGVFAAQMVNFPIPGGTSGHLLGGALAGILLGPWAGLLAITCVLIVQCFVFADGGLLALGANVFNIGVIGCLSGHFIWSLARPLATSRTQQALAAGVAAWCATVLAAAVCAVELSLSGTFGFARTFSLMVGVHAVIGVGEAIISGMVLAAWLERQRRVGVESLTPSVRPEAAIVGGIALAATIVVVLAPFSSEVPDGLERTLGWLGASDEGSSNAAGLFPDYQIPMLGEWGGTVAAGLFGVGILVASAWLVTRLRLAKPAPSVPST